VTPARLARTGLAALAVCALLAGGAWIMASRWTPERSAFPTQGIDVSYLHGAIDWPSARAARIDFAYIRASEGRDSRDPRFSANWTGARSAGVGRGALHVFTLCAAGSEQAGNFIALVPRDADALPPAIALEFALSCTQRPDRRVLLREIETFIRMVEAHSERPVMLYVTPEFDERYRVSEAIDRPLWLRSLFREPSYGAHPWVMWQANDRRSVDGVEIPVSWNVVRPE
jgi:lysozyme